MNRKSYVGDNNPNWKGGISIKPTCSKCGNLLSYYTANLCWKCYITTVERKGNKNSNWKGGVSFTNNYKKIQLKKYYQRHRIEMIKRAKDYYLKNKERIVERDKIPSRIRARKRRKNISYRISNNMSRRIRDTLKGTKLGYHWEYIVGYSIMDLKQHLEKQFTLGMNWKNYGYGWHIDHIIPQCKFDCFKKEELKKCWSLNNLQPLWANENRKKGSH